MYKIVNWSACNFQGSFCPTSWVRVKWWHFWNKNTTSKTTERPVIYYKLQNLNFELFSFWRFWQSQNFRDCSLFWPLTSISLVKYLKHFIIILLTAFCGFCWYFVEARCFVYGFPDFRYYWFSVCWIVSHDTNCSIFFLERLFAVFMAAILIFHDLYLLIDHRPMVALDTSR